MKVLISDDLFRIGCEGSLRDAEGIEVDVKVGLSPEELKEVIGEYHGLAIRHDSGDRGRDRCRNQSESRRAGRHGPRQCRHTCGVQKRHSGDEHPAETPSLRRSIPFP